MARKLTPEGLAMLKRFEGLRLTTYRCPAGKLTIGYGHTGVDVRPGMTITEDRAEELLQQDVGVATKAIERYVVVPLKDPQHDALASFIFNIGVDAFKNSTLLKLLNKGQYTECGKQFNRWIHSGGQVLPALIRRRNAERDVFFEGYKKA